jgi:hypothetical protein
MLDAFRIIEPPFRKVAVITGESSGIGFAGEPRRKSLAPAVN